MGLRVYSSSDMSFRFLLAVLAFTVLLLPWSATIAQNSSSPWEKPPGQGTGPKAASQQALTVSLPTMMFSTQGGNEFILDFTKMKITGLPTQGKPSTDGVDLKEYDLEMTFTGAEGRQIQLWFKNSEWKNVYAFPVAAQTGKPIRFNPMKDDRNVNDFSDFSHIYAVGAKVFGGLEGTKVESARLIKRN